MEMGFGVIGIGTWGRLHARVYASTPGVRLAALCDTDPERMRQSRTEFGDVPVYGDYRELLRIEAQANA